MVAGVDVDPTDAGQLSIANRIYDHDMTLYNLRLSQKSQGVILADIVSTLRAHEYSIARLEDNDRALLALSDSIVTGISDIEFAKGASMIMKSVGSILSSVPYIGVVASASLGSGATAMEWYERSRAVNSMKDSLELSRFLIFQNTRSNAIHDLVHSRLKNMDDELSKIEIISDWIISTEEKLYREELSHLASSFSYSGLTFWEFGGEKEKVGFAISSPSVSGGNNMLSTAFVNTIDNVVNFGTHFFGDQSWERFVSEASHYLLGHSGVEGSLHPVGIHPFMALGKVVDDRLSLLPGVAKTLSNLPNFSTHILRYLNYGQVDEI